MSRTIKTDVLMHNIGRIPQLRGITYTRIKKAVDETESADNGWISVKDRLPKHGKIVFCYTAYFYEVLQWDDDAEQWVGQYGVHGKQYATHWMPLPEPPKEG